MNYQGVELHLAQVHKALKEYRRHYLDKSHQAEYNLLRKIYLVIKQSNYRTFSDIELVATKEALDEVYRGIEHLQYIRRRDIPHEIIFSLEFALEDWIDNSSEFLIVTSLNNGLEQFYISLPPSKILKQNIRNLFDIEYDSKLIRINKPKLLTSNFLTGVVGYHELGHYVDLYYQISLNLLNYEPALQYLKLQGESEWRKMLHHYMEYFADIFAAQYIGTSCISYLDYIGHNAQDTSTHPSFDKRKNVVESFVNGNQCDEVDFLAKWTKIRSNKELEIRSSLNNENPLEKNIPVKVNSKSELHGLYIQGWEGWMDGDSSIRNRFDDPIKASNRINLLIKRSIRAFKPLKKHGWRRYLVTNIAFYTTTFLHNLFRK